jgi:hypothetical protein
MPSTTVSESRAIADKASEKVPSVPDFQMPIFGADSFRSCSYSS